VGIKEIYRSIRNSFVRRVQPSIYHNLVFKGGGVRGIAYMGALEVLEEKGILDRIERVAGTSSGAIAATIISFGLNVEDSLRIFNTLDLEKVPQRWANGNGSKFVNLIASENYYRLFENFGWYSSQYFHTWLTEIIADQFGGNGKATFRDFQTKGLRDIHIIASNISRHRSEDFSYFTTPDTPVADAVRLSMSIPLYFEALRYDGRSFGSGDYYVDGGLYNNYPIHVFDQPQFKKTSKLFRDGINWETLGLFLTPSVLIDGERVDIPKNLWEFLELTIRSLYDSHQISNLAENVVDNNRTINISDCGISATQFDLKSGSEAFNQLYEMGKESTYQFIKS